MARVSKFGIFFLVLMVSFWTCHTLRCQVEEGPSEEELKRVVRICMRKLGDESDRNNAEDSYEDSNSNESYDNNRRNTNNAKNGNNGRGNRFARDTDRWQQQNGYDNGYGNRNQQRYDNNRYGNNGNYGGEYGNSGFSNNESNRNFNMTNRNRNDNENDGYDKSCMIQCLFQEMKMTNNEGFPDKHKVERLVSQDVRDREMRNFLLDSIQECFHIVEMERRRDKCVFSKNIVSCLAERAKANCDDYYNETMIF
ncbi:odorant-binding protein 59a [Bradysia coprophila]|uniref:odorant-binding protein 59a n=1 Tax=Bradysia coprophila TaxID=38358 RepID=UPI00187D89E8|nr:odorant-binding protein 59a [Bradysia coprophila]